MTDNTKIEKNNFWRKLPRPFFALAPMADVTDVAFRDVITRASRAGEEMGGPDVFWTEFVSANGLNSPGREALMYDLKFNQNHHPIVAQIFSSNPENIQKAAELCRELGFDGIDINMGCPDRTIEKQGCGAKMIETPEVAKLVIRAVKAGAGNLPVSVKTRVGYRKEEIDTWIRMILEEGVDALTVHARTRKDLSKVPANWDYLKRVVKLRNEINPNTIIIGNGDVKDIEDGLSKAKESGVDGVMIGRAVLGNPWIFDRNIRVARRGKNFGKFWARLIPRKWQKKILGTKAYSISEVPLQEKLEMLVYHAETFERELGQVKSFAVMKKHFKGYVHGFPGAVELRNKLFEKGNSALEIREIIREFLG